MSDAMDNSLMGHKELRMYRIKRRIERLREWLLEDQASLGLGGPPNNWRHSPHYTSRQWGMSTGHEWWAISFTNDAGDLSIYTKYTDEDESKIRLMISAGDFRRMALWYLWRWAWGEWFGLRRRIYYWDLHRRVSRWKKNRDVPPPGESR